MGRKQKTSAGGHPTSEEGEDAAGGDKLFFLRTKYSLLDKAEWWWLMDDSLAEINSRLESEHFVVIDGFLTGAHTRSLRDEIKGAHEHGHLAPGVLAGGKAGDSTQYTMRDVRGDHVGWFDGTERLSSGVKWSTLPTAMKRADTLVNELGPLRGSELAALRKIPLADSKPGENVVGAEGVPEAIILAERKSKPLRKWRLGSYVAASMAAAAQMVSVIQLGVERWPAFMDEAPLQILTDVLVIVSGSLLWRQELKNRAESLLVIWEKARRREESLTRAEAGLGDTLWTSRMRKNLKMPGGLADQMGSVDESGDGGQGKA